MITKAVRITLIGIIFALVIIPLPSYSQSSKNEPKVEVEIGPKLDDNDQTEIKQCLTTSFKEKFPLDFISEEIPTSTGCPQLNIFNNNYEACFIVEIYKTIEPAILGGLMIYGIFHL